MTDAEMIEALAARIDNLEAIVQAQAQHRVRVNISTSVKDIETYDVTADIPGVAGADINEIRSTALEQARTAIAELRAGREGVAP